MLFESHEIESMFISFDWWFLSEEPRLHLVGIFYNDRCGFYLSKCILTELLMWVNHLTQYYLWGNKLDCQ